MILGLLTGHGIPTDWLICQRCAPALVIDLPSSGLSEQLLNRHPEANKPGSRQKRHLVWFFRHSSRPAKDRFLTAILGHVYRAMPAFPRQPDSFLANLAQLMPCSFWAELLYWLQHSADREIMGSDDRGTVLFVDDNLTRNITDP